MKIQNVNTGEIIEVHNTRTDRQGRIICVIGGRKPSPRYFSRYPMFTAVGENEKGQQILGIDHDWVIIRNNASSTGGDGVPEADSKSDASGNAEGNTDADSGNEAEGGHESNENAEADSNTDNGNEEAAGGTQTSDNGNEASDAGTNNATQGDADGNNEANGNGNEDSTEAADSNADDASDSATQDAESQPQQMPQSDNFNPYEAALRAMVEHVTNNVTDNIKPMVEAAMQAASKAAEAGSTQSQRHEYKWPDSNEPTKVDGVTCEGFDEMLLMLKRGYPVYMWGAAGCGKSHTAMQLAEALGLEFWPQSQVLFAYDIKGYGDASGNYVNTTFYKAFTQGGLFFCDEMDGSAAEALIVMNSAIANGWYEFPVVGKVKAHPDFRICAAGNTAMTGADSQYTGRTVQDASARNRYKFFKMHYDRRVELPVIAGGDAETVDFVEDMRNAIAAADLDLVVSYRQTEALADPVLRANISRRRLLEVNCFGGVETDEIRMIYAGLENKESDWAKAMAEIIA